MLSPSYSSIPNAVKARAKDLADSVAYVEVLPNGMNGSLTFLQVDEMSDAIAVYLREELKLSQGARVAIQMPNCLSYPICAYGVLKAGMVLVNTNPLYTLSEMSHQFEDAGVEALFTVDLFADKAEQVAGKLSLKRVIVARLPEFFPFFPRIIAQGVLRYWHKRIPKTGGNHQTIASVLEVGRRLRHEKAIDPNQYWSKLTRDDLACLQYTGGTTGVSKGAMLTHGNLLSNIEQILELMQSKITFGKEVILTALPLYHIFAFTVNMMAFWVIGARNVLCPNPRPISNLQRAMENEKITWISGVNTLFNALNQEIWFYESPPKTLRGAVAGGMALFEPVAKRFSEITGITCAEGYGLTETSPAACFNPLDRIKLNTIGTPMPKTEIKLIGENNQTVAQGEPGELCIRGPQVTRGYWNKPEETAKVLIDGWFHTGDIATVDADGYFKIVDRKKDMVLVSGFNVYPNEVEEALTKHPDVLEAAVIGVPDGIAGEAVKAFVVLRERCNPTPESLRAHCKTLLTNYKVPKFIEFRADLPKTPVGKILRKNLRGPK